MVLLFEERKIGPKGQVVIPKIFRKSLNLVPGARVQIHMEDGSICIRKERKDIMHIMERTAQYAVRVDSDKDYDEMQARRWKKST